MNPSWIVSFLCQHSSKISFKRLIFYFDGGREPWKPMGPWDHLGQMGLCATIPVGNSRGLWAGAEMGALGRNGWHVGAQGILGGGHCQGASSVHSVNRKYSWSSVRWWLPHLWIRPASHWKYLKNELWLHWLSSCIMAVCISVILYQVFEVNQRWFKVYRRMCEGCVQTLHHFAQGTWVCPLR
jgi:hypothetical protein